SGLATATFLPATVDSAYVPLIITYADGAREPARNPEHDRNGRPVGLAHNNRNGRQPRPIWASASSVCASASSAAVARAACGGPIRAATLTPAVRSPARPARCSHGADATVGDAG